MKVVEILTSNAIYVDEKCVGGYHEIHQINNLQSTQHLIATVDSIIKNNLLYSCKDTILEDVRILCDDSSVVDKVNEHYNGMCSNVKIYAEIVYI